MDKAREIQLEIFRSWSPERRVAVGMQLTAMAFRVREERLRARFPDASEKQLGWARVREALGLPAGLTAVTDEEASTVACDRTLQPRPECLGRVGEE